MSWSARRQLLLLSLVIFFLLAVGGLLALPYFYKAPTCSDGLQNGTEAGVDCGGDCRNLCLTQVNELQTLWARAFRVADGVYDTLAYVENQNFAAGIRKIVYTFSLYDDKNVLVTERVGKTYITPNGIIPVFEGGIRVGERLPRRTFFEFAEVPLWERVSDKAASLSLGTGNIRLESPTMSPRLSVTITNKSIYSLADVEVTALLYDEKENVIAVSRTMLDALPKASSEEAVFTWLLPFPKAPSRIEIVPRVDIFSVPF